MSAEGGNKGKAFIAKQKALIDTDAEYIRPSGQRSGFYGVRGAIEMDLDDLRSLAWLDGPPGATLYDKYKDGIDAMLKAYDEIAPWYKKFTNFTNRGCREPRSLQSPQNQPASSPVASITQATNATTATDGQASATIVAERSPQGDREVVVKGQGIGAPELGTISVPYGDRGTYVTATVTGYFDPGFQQSITFGAYWAETVYAENLDPLSDVSVYYREDYPNHERVIYAYQGTVAVATVQNQWDETVTAEHGYMSRFERGTIEIDPTPAPSNYTLEVNRGDGLAPQYVFVAGWQDAPFNVELDYPRGLESGWRTVTVAGTAGSPITNVASTDIYYFFHDC